MPLNQRKLSLSLLLISSSSLCFSSPLFSYYSILPKTKCIPVFFLYLCVYNWALPKTRLFYSVSSKRGGTGLGQDQSLLSPAWRKSLYSIKTTVLVGLSLSFFFLVFCLLACSPHTIFFLFACSHLPLTCFLSLPPAHCLSRSFLLLSGSLSRTHPCSKSHSSGDYGVWNYSDTEKLKQCPCQYILKALTLLNSLGYTYQC